jgi:hypothetical protein
MTRTFSIHKGDKVIYITDSEWKERETATPPPRQCKSWADVKELFVQLGATDEAISVCRLELEKKGEATLLVETP